MRQFCSKKLSIELEQKKTLFGKFQKEKHWIHSHTI